MSNLVIVQLVVDSSVFTSVDVRTMRPTERMVALQLKLKTMSTKKGKHWEAKRDSTIRALEMLSLSRASE